MPMMVVSADIEICKAKGKKEKERHISSESENLSSYGFDPVDDPVYLVCRRRDYCFRQSQRGILSYLDEKDFPCLS